MHFMFNDTNSGSGKLITLKPIRNDGIHWKLFGMEWACEESVISFLCLAFLSLIWFDSGFGSFSQR